MENAEKGKLERVNRAITKIQAILDEEQCIIEPSITFVGNDGKMSFDSKVIVIAKNVPTDQVKTEKTPLAEGGS